MNGPAFRAHKLCEKLAGNVLLGIELLDPRTKAVKGYQGIIIILVEGQRRCESRRLGERRGVGTCSKRIMLEVGVL